MLQTIQQNTASRIEATGEGNRIHLSQETADELAAANKGHWIKPREDKVFAKGKGMICTYWLNTKMKTSPSSRGCSGEVTSERQTIDYGSASAADEDSVHAPATSNKEAHDKQITDFNAKITRLVKWNTDVLTRMLKQIVARREASPSAGVERSSRKLQVNSFSSCLPREGKTVIDEVQEIIRMPDFDVSALNHQDPEQVQLDEKVTTQLKQYIGAFLLAQSCSCLLLDNLTLRSLSVHPHEIRAYCCALPGQSLSLFRARM